MFDWEGAGRGPAVLELGYLLLACHLDLPQLPAMQADAGRIAAVVRRYSRRRPLEDEELAWLPTAVAHDPVRLGAFAASEDRWADDVWLRKLLARHAVSAEVADVVLRYFLAGRG
jgi:Ser/Thr protein kinase RdoA (MazF antagonist)